MATLLDPLKLMRAVEASRDQLEASRKEFDRNRRELAGRHYSEGRDQIPRYVNLIAEANYSLRPFLARACEIKVAPRNVMVAPDAAVLEAKLELMRTRMDMQELEAEVIESALVAPMGIVHVGLTRDEPANAEGMAESAISVTPIHWADWVQDPGALRQGACRWEGDRYRVLKSQAVDLRLYGSDEVGPFSSVTMTTEEAIEAITGKKAASQDDDEVPATLNDGGDSEDFDILDSIRVWRICVYDVDGQTYIVHMLDGTAQNKFLKVEPYIGYGRSPYCRLMFVRVPGESIPMSYSTTIRDVAEATRILASRIVEDAKNTKTNLVYRAQGEKTANALTQASHLQGIVGEPTDIALFTIPPLGKELMPAYELLGASFTNIGGNTRLLTGSQTSADTATQEQMLAGQSQNRVMAMSDLVSKWRIDVAKRMAYFELNDPLVEEQVATNTPGGVVMLNNYAWERTTTNVDDFEFTVEVDQDFAVDPAVKQKRYLEFVDKVLGLVGPQALDAQVVLRKMGSLLGIDDADTFVADQMYQMQGVQTQQTAAGGLAQQDQYTTGQGARQGAYAMQGGM